MAAYVWLGVKRVTLKRTWRELVYYIEDEEDTIEEEMEDDITTDVEEILPALNIIPRFDDCDNVDQIECFPWAEFSFTDHGTSVVCASNNELKQRCNDNDGIPRHFEIFEILEIELRVNNFTKLDLLSCAT